MTRAIQPIGEDEKEDRVQRQALDNQLMQMKTNAADADIPQAIRSVEDKRLNELHNDEQPGQGSSEALQRLRGRKDSFAPFDKTLNSEEEQDADHKIEDLKRSIESMERRAMDTRNPEEAMSLNEEIVNARARLRMQGNAAYRRQITRYAAMYGG